MERGKTPGTSETNPTVRAHGKPARSQPRPLVIPKLKAGKPDPPSRRAADATGPGLGCPWCPAILSFSSDMPPNLLPATGAAEYKAAGRSHSLKPGPCLPSPTTKFPKPLPPILGLTKKMRSPSLTSLLTPAPAPSHPADSPSLSHLGRHHGDGDRDASAHCLSPPRSWGHRAPRQCPLLALQSLQPYSHRHNRDPSIIKMPSLASQTPEDILLASPL